MKKEIIVYFKELGVKILFVNFMHYVHERQIFLRLDDSNLQKIMKLSDKIKS